MTTYPSYEGMGAPLPTTTMSYAIATSLGWSKLPTATQPIYSLMPTATVFPLAQGSCRGLNMKFMC